MEAEAAKPRKRRLPKGTSDYQAAWILDDRWGGLEGSWVLGACGTGLGWAWAADCRREAQLV